MWCNSVGFVCWLAPLLILRSVGNCRCFVCQSSFAVSFFRVTANVLGLGEGGDFHHKTSYEARTVNLRKTVIRSTAPPLLPNPFYRQWFCPSCQCPSCFQRFYSPFTCPEKRFFACRQWAVGKDLIFAKRGNFYCLTVRLLLAYLFVCRLALALCCPQERGRQCAKSV